MTEEFPMDEVTDLIASIEMHRKEIEKESGLEASRNYALRRLQEALQLEQQATQQHGSSPVRIATAEALAVEIRRVGSLARAASHRPQQQQRGGRPQEQRHPPKSRGRRTMGRNSGR
jgi:hypothetical protein